MNTGNLNWQDELESHLDRACEAEAAGNHRDAERLFRIALLCEAKLAPEMTDARAYANQAGPVYADAEIQGKAVAEKLEEPQTSM
jgi:hypothetical protein